MALMIAIVVLIARAPFPVQATPSGSVQIDIGSASADAEGIASIPVSLVSAGDAVGGMQNDILFDNTIVSLAGATSCQLNPAIGTPPECFDDPDNTSLPCKTMNRRLRQCGTTPQPAGCPEGSGPNMSVFRALIAPTAVLTMNPIPDGVLYTCVFQVVDADRLPAALNNRDVLVSDPMGGRLTPVVAGDGAVLPPPEQTSTPTETPTPTVSATAASTPTATITPTSTQTPTQSLTPTDTATSTATATPSPTSSHTPTLSATPSPSPTVTATPELCAGDCDGSDAVTVDEITRIVSIALGTQELAVCTSGDRDGDQAITVDEIQTAVNFGLNGCPG